jgi:hypothetical protein
VVGSAAFALPVVASFTIGGKAAPKRSPLNVDAGTNPDAASNVVIGSNDTDGGSNDTDGGSNDTDGGSNTTDCGPNSIDGGSNAIDCGPNTIDGGSNDLDGGSNDEDSGSGVPGGSGIPATE